MPAKQWDTSLSNGMAKRHTKPLFHKRIAHVMGRKMESLSHMGKAPKSRNHYGYSKLMSNISAKTKRNDNNYASDLDRFLYS